MNKLHMPKEAKEVYDIERMNLPSLLLKGVGRICPVCKRHMSGMHPNRKYCSDRCKNKHENESYHNKEKEMQVGLHAFISLKKHGTNKPYRVMKVYMIKGIAEKIIITPKHKELWELLERISNFRNRPLEIVNNVQA